MSRKSYKKWCAYTMCTQYKHTTFMCAQKYIHLKKLYAIEMYALNFVLQKFARNANI